MATHSTHTPLFWSQVPKVPSNEPLPVIINMNKGHLCYNAGNCDFISTIKHFLAFSFQKVNFACKMYTSNEV